MSGWKNYDTKRTSWGATQGPVYSNPSNGSRNVWSEQYVSSTTTHYTYYHRYGWGYNVSTGTNGNVWGSDSQLGSGARHEIDLTYALTQTSNFAGNPCWKGYTCPQCGAKDIWLGQSTYSSNNYSTRWYYQEPVYTYYYYKDVVEEGNSQPSGSDYSNIVKWVQYRPKTVNTSFTEGSSTTYNGHTYTMYTSSSAITWADAKIFCEMNGGYLAVVTSAGENEVLKTLANGAYTWFGLSKTPATSWSWVNGESFSYSDWASGQPDCYDGVEFFGQYWDGSKWNDCANKGTSTSSNTKSFILEKG